MLTKTQVSTTQYSVDGSPWVRIASKSTINTDTLSYTIDGSPWWGIEDSAPPPVSTFKPIIMWMHY